MSRLHLRFQACFTLLVSLASSASCSVVAGVALPNCLSHQMNVLRVGQELAQRGHKFVWIISDSQPSSRRLVKTRGFENLVVIAYKAVDERFTKGELSRDPIKVRLALGPFARTAMPARDFESPTSQPILKKGCLVFLVHPDSVCRSAKCCEGASFGRDNPRKTQGAWQVSCPATLLQLKALVWPPVKLRSSCLLDRCGYTPERWAFHTSFNPG